MRPRPPRDRRIMGFLFDFAVTSNKTLPERTGEAIRFHPGNAVAQSEEVARILKEEEIKY